MVQVVKDPIGTKGARLSTQVSIAGRLLVYLPQDPHIGISQRIEDEAEREQLREQGPRAAAARTRRAASSCAPWPRPPSTPSSATDIEYLRDALAQIQASGSARRAPPAAALPGPLARRSACCATWSPTRPSAIIVDSRETFARLRAFAERYTPRAAAPSSSTTRASGRCSTCYGVEDEIEKALARRVDLKSRRLPDHRPDRGDDHHRRQHRRLRRPGATSTTRSSRPTSRRRRRSRASCGCATWAASSSSTSSTWKAPSTATAVLAEFRKALARDRTRDDGERLHRSSGWWR